MSKKNKIKVFLILILLIILNTFFYYYCKSNTDEIASIFYAYNLFSVFTFAIIFIIILRIGGPFSIHAISSFFIYLFLYGRSTVYIFEPEYSFFETELLAYEDLGYTNMILATIISNVFVYSINSVYVLFGRPDKISIVSNYYTIKTEKILFYIIIFCSIIFSFKLFLEYKAIINIGYASLYANGLQDVNYYSFLIKYSHVFFYSFFSFYLIVVNNKRHFLVISFIFLLVSFLDSLKGARITLILPIFFILWYYNSVYKISINYKTFIRGAILLILLLFFSIYSSSKRSDLDADFSKNIIITSITETGSTLQVVARYIKNKDQLKVSSPFFLEPVLYPYFYLSHFSILTKGQSDEILEYRTSLNHHLSALINKEAYLAGSANGSSSVAEFYQYGFIPLILFSFLYGILLLFFYSLINNRFIIFSSTTLVTHIFFFARDTPLPNLIGIMKSIVAYCVLMIIFSKKK